ncbi:MAG: hypothetical protein PHQ35_10700 [Phycisphaerae bacterium]|nr:hypothetical protein [Phycisphaerae bacterium]
MAEIKITPDEEKIVLLIKKHQMIYPDCKKFLDLFCICVENRLFDCRNGKKILHFDGDGKLRQIESQKIDYRA